MGLDDSLEKLKSLWLNDKVNSGTAASVEDLRLFESKHGVSLPEELKRYFTTVNGMENSPNNCDNNMMAFWSLKDVRPLHEEMSWHEIDPSNSFFVFADYSIWCWAYAVRLLDEKKDSTPVYVVHDEIVKIATSFTEFIARYVTEGMSLVLSLSPIDDEPPIKLNLKREKITKPKTSFWKNLLFKIRR